MTLAQLRYLDDRNRGWVAKHLVMAGRLLDVDPELAYQHTMAASRRGGRVAVVREAVGIAAYHAERFADAVRELRTHRRISGSNENVALIADALRGMGRPQKAIEMAREEDLSELPVAMRVEMHMVVAGAYADLGQLDKAVAELEALPQLDFNRAYSYSPRLFTAYADLLSTVGRAEEAKRWNAQVAVAEEALGVDNSMDSFIIDLAPEMDEEEQTPRAKDLVEAEASATDADAAAEQSADEDDLVASDKTGEQGIDEEDGLNEVPSTDEQSETN
ncbi:hypothetical protein [Glutamicibacter sp. PS]|uniref:hypothetical protein n=1 Tax=Glutamicibacter sp. PS TaxID=3075634 RepID=UPI00283B2512|nr:hypothetical protein [Glutamicibacter sp. PS]MDR4533296.1 hypothetical protein [Glutamicibacter sp. PS]